MVDPGITRLGSSAVLVSFGGSMSRETSARVHSLVRAVACAQLDGVIDVAPAYTTIAVYFDSRLTNHERVADSVGQLVREGHEMPNAAVKLVEIPVRYDGVDLAEVAERCALPVDEVVRRHSAVTYDVYMIGFVPGFAYLGSIDPSLVLPRRSPPRTRVPAGSVAIAGTQTGVYPRATPGGWNILGTTNVKMFDVTRDQPSLLQPGDRVRFVPMSG
jgi:inhibitor of KinA